MSVLLYANHITPRLQYIADLVSETFFNKQVELTSNLAKFQHFEGLKINYSEPAIARATLHIQPVHLLFEKGAIPQTIDCFDWQGLKVFFRTGGDISFDIFAASFYLITRYEEYLPHAKDEFGRYAHINSLAFREHFLHLPLVNMWWHALLKVLQRKYNYTPPGAAPAFRFVPTYDVDIAFRYKAKGAARTAGAIAKDLSQGNLIQVKKRIAVLAGKGKDPFDTFDWLYKLHQQHQLQPLYFFLLSAKKHRFDKNNSIHSPSMKRLVQQEAARQAVGIHPSWQSNQHLAVLNKEIQWLQQLTGKPVVQSRQHYIKMTLPHTYRRLTAAGILHDYSMGYGSINGFRASVASPFYWYDLEAEEASGLLIHPFCFMDANAIFEQRQTAEVAMRELEQYYNNVKAVNGTLITVFHNHFLTEEPEWRSWRKGYASFLQKYC